MIFRTIPVDTVRLIKMVRDLVSNDWKGLVVNPITINLTDVLDPLNYPNRSSVFGGIFFLKNSIKESGDELFFRTGCD